jgi:flavin reductase (DIM6/NTAB) family NADH-FMN oxidoreductase RutF
MADREYYSYNPIEGHGLPHDPFNSIVGPRPIGWISCRDEDGTLNLAPYSFFNAFNYYPHILGFSSTSWKDSIAIVEKTRESVWNLVTMDLAEAMNTTATGVARDVDEFKLAGLTPVPSRSVSVPRVGESRVAMECKLVDIIQLSDAAGKKAHAWLALGQVVDIHIDKSLLKDGIYQTAEARPILRAGRLCDYAQITPGSMFEMYRPPDDRHA